MGNITLHTATSEDFEEIWSIYHRVLQGADSYTYPADTSKEYALNHWMAPDVSTYVARLDGKIAGTFILRVNRPGYGSHVANASFMVSPDFQKQGIGRTMGIYCLEEAKRQGFLSIQYNFVVSTNLPAVNLWKSLGFEIIGTIPQGFRHGKLGLVDAYIMHRFL